MRCADSLKIYDDSQKNSRPEVDADYRRQRRLDAGNLRRSGTASDPAGGGVGRAPARLWGGVGVVLVGGGGPNPKKKHTIGLCISKGL